MKSGTHYEQGGYFCFKVIKDGRTYVRKRKSKRDLDQAVKQLLVSLEAGSVDTSSQTFEQVAREKFEFRYGRRLASGELKLAPGVAYKSFISTERNLAYAICVVGAKKIGKIGLAEVKALIATYRDRGRTCSLVVNLFLQMLPKTRRDFITDAMSEHGVKVPYKAESRERTLDMDECRKIVFDPDERGWYQNTIVCFIGGGFRYGEAAGLTWDRVNLDTGAVHIDRQGQWVPGKKKGHPVFQGDLPTKNRKVRTVFLTDDALTALKAQREQIPEECPWVFPSQSLRPLRNDVLNHVLNAYLEKKKVSKASLHDLRRTYATLLASVEPNVANTAAMIGDTVGTTTRHYIKQMDPESGVRKVQL